MLLPKRVKFRKQHRGRMTGKAMRGNTVSHGEYGLQALQPAWITSNQIEAARIAMTRYIKRGEFKEFPLLGAETLKMLGGTYNPTWTADTKAMLQVCGLSVSHVEVKDGLITIE